MGRWTCATGRTACGLAAMLWVLTSAAITQAQVAPTPLPLPIGGVYVDADGMLRSRQVASNSRLADLRRRPGAESSAKEDLAYISLPRLFSQVKALVEAGKPVPDEMKYLHGMTKLRYVFVFPEEKDLVIAGVIEPLNANHQGRPLGTRTGRPVLRLDDLVTALRTIGPGSRADGFGCSIDLTQQQLNNMVTEARNWGAITASKRPEMAAALAKAVGPQGVRFLGVEPNTMLAFVCVEADYILKRVSLGLDSSRVPQVPSALSMTTSEDGLYRRFWFEPMYEPLLVSEDGNAYEIRGQALQVKATGTIDRDQPKAGAGAQKFADLFTQHFETIAERNPVFADLWNITDLGLLAALINQDKLHTKVGWDLSWVLESSGYPVAEVPVPRTADSLVNYVPRSGRTSFAVGGVMIRPGQFVRPDSRQKDQANVLTGITKRPEGDAWTTK